MDLYQIFCVSTSFKFPLTNTTIDLTLPNDYTQDSTGFGYVTGPDGHNLNISRIRTIDFKFINHPVQPRRIPAHRPLTESILITFEDLKTMQLVREPNAGHHDFAELRLRVIRLQQQYATSTTNAAAIDGHNAWREALENLRHPLFLIFLRNVVQAK